LKKSILLNWNFFRILRLAAGIAIMVQAVMVKDFFLGTAGFLFSILALFNAGCCATGGCYSPASKHNNMVNAKDEINYEEVE
jgi:hypothetical protein